MQALTSVQSQVLAGLLAGQPIAQVARDNGIHRSTIYNWRHQHPQFTFALDQARSRLQTSLYDEVQDLAARALAALGEFLESPDPAIKLRAAQTILRAANPMRANRELQLNVGVETLADHLTGRQAIQALAAGAAMAAGAVFDESPSEPAAAPEFDTIRHFSTQKMPSTSEPARNQRCPCNSGLKYKRCCGNPARSPRAAA